MKKIKGCPFCGSEPDLFLKISLNKDIDNAFYIECKSCDRTCKSDGYNDTENVIDSWNYRNENDTEY